jgi:hypothetical protein
MEVRGQLRASAAVSLGKEPPVPFEHEAGCAPEPFWTLWRREKYFTTTSPRLYSASELDCTDCAISAPLPTLYAADKY